MKPAPDTFPSRLAAREYVDIPSNLDTFHMDRAKRRIGRLVLDAFWWDMGLAHYSAQMQINDSHPLHDAFMDGARANRERVRIHRERAFKHRAQNTTTTLQAPAVSGDGRARVLPKASTENGTLGSGGNLA